MACPATVPGSPVPWGPLHARQRHRPHRLRGGEYGYHRTRGVSLFAIWLVFWIATCHPAGRVAGLRRPLIGTPESPIGGNDQFQPRGCLIRLARITTIGHPRLGLHQRAQQSDRQSSPRHRRVQYHRQLDGVDEHVRRAPNQRSDPQRAPLGE